MESITDLTNSLGRKVEQEYTTKEKNTTGNCENIKEILEHTERIRILTGPTGVEHVSTTDHDGAHIRRSELNWYITQIYYFKRSASFWSEGKTTSDR